MGFRGAVVLAATSFFMGMLCLVPWACIGCSLTGWYYFLTGIQFICFNVDYRILYTPLTEETINDGFQFYTTFYNAPPAITALLHGVIGVGILALLAKIHAWDDSAMFFDGSSLGACHCMHSPPSFS